MAADVAVLNQEQFLRIQGSHPVSRIGALDEPLCPASIPVSTGGALQRLLRLPEPPAPDAADALALALTHAQENGRYNFSAPKRI